MTIAAEQVSKYTDEELRQWHVTANNTLPKRLPRHSG